MPRGGLPLASQSTKFSTLVRSILISSPNFKSHPCSASNSVPPGLEPPKIFRATNLTASSVMLKVIFLEESWLLSFINTKYNILDQFSSLKFLFLEIKTEERLNSLRSLNGTFTMKIYYGTLQSWMYTLDHMDFNLYSFRRQGKILSSSYLHKYLNY